MESCSAAASWNDIVSQIGKTLHAANAFIMDLLTAEGLVGLVPSHGDILVHLLSSREPVPMTCLADAIGKDPSTVTALMKKLADGGYVSLRKSAEDRRVTLAELTEKGRALSAGAERINRALLATAALGLSDEEMLATRRALDIMRKNFETARKDRTS